MSGEFRDDDDDDNDLLFVSRMDNQLQQLAPTAILLGFAILMICCRTNALRYITTSQILPSECWRQIQLVSGCPTRDQEQDELYWASLSRMCCQAYPETILHCQIIADSIFPACFRRMTVKKGYFMEIEANTTGNPVLKVRPCSEGYFEVRERQSDTLRYPYCLEGKSTCRENGQMLLCRGGSEEDDICICSHDYTPRPNTSDCQRGFNQHSGCRCVKQLCPNGTRRLLSENSEISCKNVSREFNYTCYPIPEEDSPKPCDEVSESHPDDEQDQRRKKGVLEERGHSNSSVSSDVLIAVLTSVVVIGLAAAAAVIYFLRRRNSGTYIVLNKPDLFKKPTDAWWNVNYRCVLLEDLGPVQVVGW